MDFIDALRQFSTRAEKLKPQILTEEATKTALIMPFFHQILGYDIFNPDEFLPEFVADVGIKKGEKVDYAIFLNGEPTILIEAKWCGAPLEKYDSQLFRYFGTTKAKLAILTNGIIYKFYTDLEEQNKMDLKPFLELDMMNIKESLVPELKRFCKPNFDATEIIGRASELRYTHEIKSYFSDQLNEPSDSFVKFLMSRCYDGAKTAQVVEKFRDIVKSALNSLISEMMNERITSALKTTPKQIAGNSREMVESEISADVDDKYAIVTTEEELQAFYIVKALLLGSVDIAKINYKDTTQYFSIIYSNMSGRWICRLRLSEIRKTISFPDETGREIRTRISSIEDIYGFSAQIIESAKRFFD